jgi:hypothetical protein
VSPGHRRPLIPDSFASARKWRFQPNAQKAVAIVCNFRLTDAMSKAGCSQFMIQPPNFLRFRLSALRTTRRVPRASTLSPLVRLSGHNPSHEEKCASVFHRLMSSPTSLIKVWAALPKA